VFADPQVLARGMVVELPYKQAEGGAVKGVANPVRLSATPPDYRRGPPALGEHTQAVLGGVLGMASAEITALREKGVV